MVRDDAGLVFGLRLLRFLTPRQLHSYPTLLPHIRLKLRLGGFYHYHHHHHSLDFHIDTPNTHAQSTSQHRCYLPQYPYHTLAAFDSFPPFSLVLSTMIP
jgi:hypothetical protein